jgi:2'-5' RNA ligase
MKQLNLFDPAPLDDSRYLVKPPVTVYEYFILISPDIKVKEYVKNLKNRLNQKIGLTEENVRSVPHLSLMLLRKGKLQDTMVIEKTKQSLLEEPGFKIELNKAVSFDHPETNDIVLNIENPEPVKKIFNKLLQQFEPGRNHPRFFSPHITIGRGIPKKDFEKISSSLNEFDLKTEFLCRSVTILRREVSRGIKSRYERIGEVSLRN